MLLVFAFLIFAIFLNFISTSSQSYEFRWWDANWHYRVGLEINNTGYNRTNWTIEYEINFTKLLHDLDVYGTFDENSIHVIEYNSTGSILYEIPSQFDKAEDYNESENAFGTLVFMLNGTTLADQKRYFMIYFDTKENGEKSKPNYISDLSYNYTSNFEELNINNSLFRWWIDTERGENTSGIYLVQAANEQNILFVDPSNNRTVEYSQFSNDSHTFGFDFRNNATFKYVGASRIVVEQKGYEVFWNEPENRTNEGYLIKRYIFYPYSDWIKIEQIFVNNASYNITRKSTSSGALAIDIGFSFDTYGTGYPNMSNTNDPGSYVWAAEATGTYFAGIVNIYENNTNNFFASHSDTLKRMGIELSETNITSGSSIKHIAAIIFNASGQAGQEEYFLNFVNQSITPINITLHPSEKWEVKVEGKFYINQTHEASIFNRNESVLIKANVTDLYNISSKVNVTLDLGGAGELNLTLYDDGTHGDEQANDKIYTNIYNISDSDVVGLWNATFKVYNGTWHLLNFSWSTFNVTNVYNVSVVIENPTGFVERLVKAKVYVMNYRRDRWITNANINCTFNGNEVPQSNITDNGDGTYNVSFIAPSYAGLFALTCEAKRNNNTGYSSDEFTCDTYTTNVSIESIPSSLTYDNVTAFTNQSFDIVVIAKNIANGTAHDLNITLEFPNSNITANTTLENCGEVLISKNCTKNFKIIVLNATPSGDYNVLVKAVWRNSDNTIDFNTTELNITVLKNPILEVSKNYILGVIGAGKPLKNIDNFTVISFGNEPLENISFNISGFSENFTFVFVPNEISDLGVGLSQNVEIWVNTTNEISPGEYNGTLNVSSKNNGFKIINLTIGISGTYVAISVDRNNYTASNVTWYKNESFPIFVNTTNIGNATAYNATIKLNFSSPSIVANESIHPCGHIPKEGTCNASFIITILNQTRSGNYTLNVSIEWENPEEMLGINISTVNITVLSNVNLHIPQDSISTNVTHGTEKEIAVLTLNSTGNDPVENISFSVYNFSSNFTFKFIPSEILSLDGEYYQGVKVNVSVAFGQPPGNYSGKINVTTNNAGYKEINITIEVPLSRTWTINTTFCEKPESPPEDIACVVLLNNTGNMPINFSITPITNSTNMYNFTWTNETNFTIGVFESRAFSVWYNITNQQIKFYYANYTIDAIQSGAQPDYVILQVVLNPYIKPLISIAILPNQTEQTGSVMIYANVTDQGGAGIGYNSTHSNVTVTVTRPDGTNTTIFMNFYGGTTQGGTSYWRASYPNNPYEPSVGFWGNTTLKGYYNVTVFVIDNKGQNNTANASFFVYYKLLVDLNSSSYVYRGDQPEIRMKSHDVIGTQLSGVNITLTLIGPDGSNRDIYMIIGGGNFFTTDSNGDAVGIFLIPSNAMLGNYTFLANSSYYESSVNKTIYNISSYTLEVQEVSEVKAEIAIPEWVYISQTIPITLFVWDNGVPSEPDSVNLTIFYRMPCAYCKSGEMLVSVNRPWGYLNKSSFAKVADGFYTYQSETLSETTTATGNYVAFLQITRHGKTTGDAIPFRISRGGPYDVDIISIESEVPRGDYLDFELLIENRGDVSQQDVFVEFWISGENQTWDYGNASIQVDAHTQRTLVRNLFIYSFQPTGQYVLNAKVTYDPNLPPATANRTFYVVEGAPPQPPSPPGGPPRGEEAPGAVAPQPPKIEITKYSTEIGIEVDGIKYSKVEVKNTGGTKLYNVSLRITGIP
ncbi:MAG: choice-of-anchor X domain-containing protein, partial [Candidatus Aenigmatarchaeota archaeon]